MENRKQKTENRKLVIGWLHSEPDVRRTFEAKPPPIVIPAQFAGFWCKVAQPRNPLTPCSPRAAVARPTAAVSSSPNPFTTGPPFAYNLARGLPINGGKMDIPAILALAIPIVAIVMGVLV